MASYGYYCVLCCVGRDNNSVRRFFLMNSSGEVMLRNALSCCSFDIKKFSLTTVETVEQLQIAGRARAVWKFSGHVCRCTARDDGNGQFYFVHFVV